MLRAHLVPKEELRINPLPLRDLVTLPRESPLDDFSCLGDLSWHHKRFSVYADVMDLDALQTLSLAIAEERGVEAVLGKIVEGLNRQAGIALARVWLREPGDVCATCVMRQECPDSSFCLHLVASAGVSLGGGSGWTSLTGDFRRFPLGVRKIGRIGETGEALLLEDVSSASDWIARPGWIEAEGIRSFAGQPLVFRGEVLGVLAVFSRAGLKQQDFRWLRMLADHAAVAIANGRAFAEIEALREQLKLENEYLRQEVREEGQFTDIVGTSPVLTKVLEQIALVAPSEANVLVLGESGTGKELIACAIHDRSARSSGPLVKVNCASIPRDLFESEFFGHVRGAFTGAVRDRIGRFQLADGGTLFLDEVGEIPLDLQSKLLRVIQEGNFERVGEDKTRRTRVRIVAATNRDLRKEVEAGRFREDLYYRLSVFPIEMPPLRDRREDIPSLVAHFLGRARQKTSCTGLSFSKAQLRQLQEYSWPGNVRELQNVIERAIILSGCGSRQINLQAMLTGEGGTTQALAEVPSAGFLTQAQWDLKERENLLLALRSANWKIYGEGGAAQLLGVKPTTLASRMKAFGIRKTLA